jgi:hypothetical protein
MIRLLLTSAIVSLTMGVSASAQTVTVRLPPTIPTAPAAPTTATTPAVAAPALDVAKIRSLAREADALLRDVVLRGALDPAITGRNAAPVQAVALEVGKDGETVGKAKLSWRLDDYGSAFDIILRGPINQSSGIPLTDRGLASGASATVGYNLTLWGSTLPADVDRLLQSRIDGARLSPMEAVVATGLAIEARHAEGDYEDPILQKLNMPASREAFSTRTARVIAAALRKEDIGRLTRTLSLRGSYGVGSATFKFAELAEPISEKSEAKRDRSTAVSVAYVQVLQPSSQAALNGAVEAPLMLISGGYADSDRWKPGRTRQICTPLDVASATECRALVIGAPTKSTEKSVEIDIRSWSYAQKLGINPHFSYDRTSKKWTSEVALSYLVLNKPVDGLPQLDSKALTVGVRIGSRPTDDGGTYAAVFFGTVLSK